MRKLCHVTSVHPRYDQRIFAKQCVSLAQAGYDITLAVIDEMEDEVKNGVGIVSTGVKPKTRRNRFALLYKSLWPLLKQIDADLYHFHDPELMPLAVKMKRLYEKKIIFDFHEDTQKQIMDKSWIPARVRSLISRTYGIYLGYSVKKYDALISVTPEIVDKLLRYNDTTKMITNYPIVQPSLETKKDRTTICFAGGIANQWNHDKIINAINGIDGVKYLLLGSGPEKYLNFLKKLPGWGKVDFKGRVQHHEVRNYLTKASMGLALNYSTQIEGEGSLGNTKLFEYMEAGLPVICSNYRLWNEIIDKYECGISVNPLDVEEITEAIKYLINNPDKAIKMGLNGRKAVVEHYNWQSQEKVLIDLYRLLLEE